jgi:hypothetical protein
VTSPPQPHPVISALPGRILGIDAGGSATRVVLLEGGEVTARPAGPPMNALLTPRFAGQLQDIIGTAGPTAVGIGLPGVRSASQARRLSQTLTRRAGCPVHVTDDDEYVITSGNPLARRSAARFHHPLASHPRYSSRRNSSTVRPVSLRMFRSVPGRMSRPAWTGTVVRLPSG